MTRTIRPGDAEWPDQLDELGGEPPVDRLFARGRPIDCARPSVAVVGTRRPTASGIDAATEMSRALAEAGFAVVSGLAVGIDAAAHRAALATGGYTIAVLGCGLDVPYPLRNLKLKDRIAAEGTLLSEYPNGTHPTRGYFPSRNRIIAGLAVGVVVVEGALTSGALVTARLALDANRCVFAIPGSWRNPTAAGPNELIRTGRASLVTEPRHIFEELAPSLVWTRGRDSAESSVVSGCDETERALLQALDDVPTATDKLVTITALPAGRLAIALSKLEVRGLVTRDPAGYALSTSGARLRRALSGLRRGVSA